MSDFSFLEGMLDMDDGFFAADINGDGVADSWDMDGDGTMDAWDSNRDGIADNWDTDGDGYIDLMDLDSDGIADVEFFDTDGDGFSDSYARIDFVDTDGDGFEDTITNNYDLGTDGQVDGVTYMTDTDHDGIGDTYGEITGYDTDGDGLIDTFTVAEDFNLDHVFDVEAVVDQSGYVTDSDWMDHMDLDNTFDEGELFYNISQAEHFNPSQYDADDIIGDPAEAMTVYHTQETDTSCAVASQEFVLDQLTGRDYTEAQLRDLAEDNGWYTLDEGTPMYDVGELLRSQGLDVESDYGNSLSDIENCLENGGAVIVGVDAYEVYGVGNDFGPGMDANHALQVIGIDQSDPGNPMMILNDPGTENGAGVMVPMNHFMDAWADSDNFMVEAYAN
jgi:hypothetical protein